MKIQEAIKIIEMLANTKIKATREEFALIDEAMQTIKEAVKDKEETK